MKFNEYKLIESVTFSAYKEGIPWSTKVIKDCEACEGTGIEDWGNEKHPCHYCKDGKYESDEPIHAETNIANDNADVIFRMLGIQSADRTGQIENKDIPEFKRKLIRLKNGNTDQYARDDTFEPNSMTTSREGNVTRIHKKQMDIYNFGLPAERIREYIDGLIKVADDAQKIGGMITFG